MKNTKAFDMLFSALQASRLEMIKNAVLIQLIDMQPNKTFVFDMSEKNLRALKKFSGKEGGGLSIMVSEDKHKATFRILTEKQHKAASKE